MRKVKTVNGYTIYEHTTHDIKDGLTVGEFSIYFSSDVREYGREYSDPEFIGVDSLKIAIDLCECSNVARAKEIIERHYTYVDYDALGEVTGMLDAGVNPDVISAYIEGEEGDTPKITENHTGKMHGLQSMSTAVTCNSHCKRNQCIKGSICEHCYAENMSNQYSALNAKLTVNYEILTRRLLQLDELPVISSVYFRFEAFGDLENTTQFINYLNICRANPAVNFAIWTKNPEIMHAVFESGIIKKPANLKIIVSSLMINEVRNVEKYRYFVDHVFTVYNYDFLKDHPEIRINCGAKSCLKCHLCYTHKTDEPFYINEILKADVKKCRKAGIFVND